jgi:hypothetical protein
VGEPTGTFGIKIMHGGTTLIDNPFVTVPGDIKLTDGTSEDYVPLGTIGGSGETAILKIVSDNDPDFRIVHFYIDLPASLDDIYRSSGGSLFDPADAAAISVTITGLAFTDTTEVFPMLADNETYLAAYMRDTYMETGGRFYELPGCTHFAPGVLGAEAQCQVAGNKFYDGDTSQYTFSGSFFEPTASWTWGALPNPGAVGASAVNADGSLSDGDGRVFELGLSVAFVGVPEPGTIGLLVSGLVAFISRRGRTR